MLDDTEKLSEAEEDSSPTPRVPGGPVPPFDQTIKLERSIAQRGPSVPATFGRYQVIKRIGIGGFASVFSARDPKLDAIVAIKVLAENHSANTEVRRRFVAEARVARRLASERLVSVFDVGETDDGRPYVVMELASGGTLRSRVSQTGRPNNDELLRLIDELGACMIAIHANDVVHRDIKPSNLLLRVATSSTDQPARQLIGDDERLILGDLGLARDISDGASALTVGGGTAGYMAPEQADPDGKADFRADIYAATVVVAELTTGRHRERLDLPSAELSPTVRQALESGLSLDRERRPPSAIAWRDEMLSAYETFAREEPAPSSTHPESDPEHDETAIAPTLSDARSDLTGRIDPTKVKAPYPYNSELHSDNVAPAAAVEPKAEPLGSIDPEDETNVLADDPTATIDTPRTWVEAPPDEDGPPPPPPSIPLSPRIQRPPPDVDPPARLQEPTAGEERTGPTADLDHGAGDALETRPVAPRRPVVPRSPTDHRPQPATQPVPGASARPPAGTPAAPGPGVNQPPSGPPVVGGSVAEPPAAVTDSRPNPPSSASGRRPVAPSQQAARALAPPSVPAGRSSLPVHPPAVIAPPVGSAPQLRPSPPRVGVAPAVVAELPTKRQLKLQEKAVRRHERMRRRRRRRRKFSNLIRAILRGFFAAFLTQIIAAVVATAANGTAYDQLPRSTLAVINIAVLAAFVIGIRVFPRPRRLDPDG